MTHHTILTSSWSPARALVLRTVNWLDAIPYPVLALGAATVFWKSAILVARGPGKLPLDWLFRRRMLDGN